MPVPATPPPIPITVGGIVANALREIGAYSQSETPSAADASFVLSKLNDMLDQWAAVDLYVYAFQFLLFTLTPNLQPHTIGPTSVSTPPTFIVTGNRPNEILNAAIVLPGSETTTDVPVTIRDADWWAGQTVKQIVTSIPTDMYYEPDWPNGSMYLWPIPNVAYGIRLETWTNITQFLNLKEDFYMPPGYRRAVTLSLAESLTPAFGRALDPNLARQAQQARVIIQSLNANTPKIKTRDAGIPSGGKFNSAFNWQSGQTVPYRS